MAEQSVQNTVADLRMQAGADECTAAGAAENTAAGAAGCASGTAIAQVDLTKVKPYGDTLNDGMTEVAFTLPVPYGDEADEAARQLARKMGLDEPNVVYSKSMTEGYTFFVIYGKCQHTVDFTTIKVAKVEVDVMDRLECAEYIKENIRRPVVMVGASTGTDAHTVGIDAIMNMKGFHGHFGLERYEGVRPPAPMPTPSASTPS